MRLTELPDELLIIIVQWLTDPKHFLSTCKQLHALGNETYVKTQFIKHRTAGMSVTKRVEWALNWHFCSVAVLKRVKRGGKVNWKEIGTPVWALKKDNVELVQWLVKKGASFGEFHLIHVASTLPSLDRPAN